MKIFKKLTALTCCAALLMSLFTAFSISPAASSASSIKMRVEGQKATIYSGNVSFTQGENFYTIMTRALTDKNIPYSASADSYGHMFKSIGGESGTYPVWWHLYVNGVASEVGTDSLIPSNGDEVVFYLGDDSVVLYPTIKFTPAFPVAGQRTTVNVSATYTDYSNSSSVQKTVNISGVKINFNGSTYMTGTDGSAAITMPAAGTYTMSAVKEAKDTTPAIVRTGNIPVKVYSNSGTSSGNNNSGSTQTKEKSTSSVSSKIISAAISAGADYIQRADFCDWNAAFALSTAGRSVPNCFLSDTADELSSDSSILPTHLAGLIIGLKSAGADPCSFIGKNLVEQLYSSNNIGKTGLNGYAYGLLAFDCGNYSLPSGAAFSRDSLINSILSYQKMNGAFSLDISSAADIDMTAIAITALAPYTGRANVKDAVNKAVKYLSDSQKSDGGFVPPYSKNEACESTAQVIIALASVNIDPQSDTRFVKSGKTPVGALLSFKNSDGGFSHIKGSTSDLMATEQAVMALSSLERFQSAGKRIYNLTAVKITAANPDTGDTSQNPAVILIAAAALSVLALSRKRKPVKKS